MAAAGHSGGDKFGRAAGESAGKRFGGSFKRVAGALIGGYAALRVKDFLTDSVAEARESQKVGALTAQVIKSTGKAAHVSAKQVGDLATKISNKTGIDDEAIQAGENLILTFKGIKNEAGAGNKIFDRTTQVVTDMSVALGQDMKSSSIQVGKALNDPIKGVTALQRVGVSFTEQQKAQIKTMVQSGDTLGAQKLILHELNSEFGGAAAAASTSGEKVRNAFNNIKEGIGTALLPVIDDVENAILTKGIPAAQDFVNWFTKKGVPAIRDFGDEVRPLANSLLPAMGDALGIVRDVLKEGAPYAKKMVDAFNDAPDWVKTAIVGGGATAILGKKLGAFKLASGIFGQFTKGGVQKVFVVNNGFGGGTAKDAAGAATKAGGAAAAVARVLSGAKALGGASPEGVTAGISTLADWLGDRTVQQRSKHALPKLSAAIFPNAPGGQPLAKGKWYNPWATKWGGDDLALLDKTLSKQVSDRPLKTLALLQKAAKDANVPVTALIANLPKTAQSMGLLDGKFGDAKNSADKTSGAIGGVKKAVDDLPGKVDLHVRTPELPESLRLVQRYGSLLDGLDGRVVRTFIKTTTTKVAGQLGTTDSGETSTRFGGHRASGGDVDPRYYYAINERGQEFFRPTTRGRVATSSEARGGGGSQRVVLDFGAGRTLTGWIREEIDNSAEFARTTGGRR